MRVAAIGLGLILVLGMMGCGASESSQINRARLVANENRKLVGQLEEKDKRIAELEAELAKVQAESKEQIEQLQASSSDIIGQMMIQQQELQAEIERLKSATN